MRLFENDRRSMKTSSSTVVTKPSRPLLMIRSALLCSCNLVLPRSMPQLSNCLLSRLLLLLCCSCSCSRSCGCSCSRNGLPMRVSEVTRNLQPAQKADIHTTRGFGNTFTTSPPVSVCLRLHVCDTGTILSISLDPTETALVSPASTM